MMSFKQKSVVSDADIMMYLALGLKHLRLMILLVCFSVTLGLVYYIYARPCYYSKSIVSYTKLLRPTDTERVYNDRDRTVESDLIRELTSPHIVARAAKKLGISATEGEMARKYVRRVMARYSSDRNIILEVYPYSFALARDLPKLIVQEYLLNRDERRLAQMRISFQSFTADLAELRTKMDEAFNTKFDFRDSNELTKIFIDLNEYKDVPTDLYTTKHKLTLMDNAREALQAPGRDTVAKLSLLAGLQKDIQSLAINAQQVTMPIAVGDVIPKEDASSGVVVVPSIINSDLSQPWQAFDKERRRLQQLAQETGRIYLPGHPKMVAIQKQLDAVNKSLELELEAEQNRNNIEYAALVDRKEQLEKRLPIYDEVNRRYQKSIRDLAHFDKGQLAWHKLYDEMSRRLQALDFTEDKQRVQLQYLSLLENDKKPVSPHRFRLALYTLLMGLALAIAIPFLLEYVDSRISDVDQVEEALRIRGLGVVPKLTETPVDDLLLPDAKHDHHVTENFRLIRTNLVMNAPTPALPQVILVTSAMPQEGKSVVASHLAMSFARKGEKTLLIDADLRRGRMHRVFACPNRPGLGEVLTGKHPLEASFRPILTNGHDKIHSNDPDDHVEPNGHSNLTLLTCGKHMHWASELLDSHVFPKIMDELRQKFQRIIIDTPPVLGLSETSIIQRSADGVVLVIWSEYTAMRNVKTAIQMLQTNGAKFSGFILNRLDFSSLTNRYRYFYYSPYYYRRYKTLTAPNPVPK